MTPELLQQLDTRIAIVDKHIAAAEIEEATQLLFETIREYPEYGKSYNYLGWIYDTKQRRYNEAEELYKKCIELMPEYPAAYLNYLYVLNMFQRGEDAQKIIDILSKMSNVNRYRLLKEWAFMLEYTGKLEDAVAKQKEAILSTVTDAELDEAQRDMERIRRKINFLKKEL